MICAALPSLLTIHVTALKRLCSKLLTILCVLRMMAMWLSWPFLICLLLSVLSTTIFSYTDFSLSTALLFHSLSLTLLVGLRLRLLMIRVHDLRMFLSVSHRGQFLVLSSPFFTLHLSPLWLKLILSSTSLLPMTHSYFTLVLLIRYMPLSWPCGYASLTWRPGWHKTNWNWMMTRQRFSL